MRLGILILSLGLACGCEKSQPDQTVEPTKNYLRGKSTHNEPRAKFEITGIGGTCLKCGKDFMAEPDSDGVIVLTPICPECQRKKGK
jgi:hypothetical protein